MSGLVYSVKKCGRGLAPDEGVSVTYLLTDPAPSGASRIVAPPLPQLDLHRSEISTGQVDLGLVLLCLLLPWNRPELCLVYSVKCGRGLAPDEGVSVTYLLADPALSGASPLPQLDFHRSEISIGQVDLGLLLLCLLLPWNRPELCLVYSVKCGRGLAPDEGVSVTYLLTDPALSGASPLPHLDLHKSEISIGQVDLGLVLLCFCSAFALLLLWLLILILGAPLNHAGRTQA